MRLDTSIWRLGKPTWYWWHVLPVEFVSWKMILKWRWRFVAIAIMLYTYRFFQFQMRVPSYHLAIESNFWIISVFAFASKYLNHPSKTLTYLSQAAYPVYILFIAWLMVDISVGYSCSHSIHFGFAVYGFRMFYRVRIHHSKDQYHTALIRGENERQNDCSLVWKQQCAKKFLNHFKTNIHGQARKCNKAI